MAIYGGNGGISPVVATAPKLGCCDCAGLFWNVADAPDSASLFVDNTSQIMHFTDCGAKGSAFATGCAFTDPTFRYHANTNPITEYTDVSRRSTACCIAEHRTNLVTACPCASAYIFTLNSLNGFGFFPDTFGFPCFVAPSRQLCIGHGFYIRTMSGAVAICSVSGGAGDQGGDLFINPGAGSNAVTGCCGVGGCAGDGGGILMDANNGGTGATGTNGGLGGDGGDVRLTGGRGGNGAIATGGCCAFGGCGGDSGSLILSTDNGGSGAGVTGGASCGGNGGNAGAIFITGGIGGNGGCQCGDDDANGGIGGTIRLTVRNGGIGRGAGCAGANGAIVLRAGGATACFDAVQAIYCSSCCAVAIGFFNTTPVPQQTHIADVAVGCQGACYSQCAINTDLNALECKINTILAQLAALGLQACA